MTDAALRSSPLRSTRFRAERSTLADGAGNTLRAVAAQSTRTCLVLEPDGGVRELAAGPQLDQIDGLVDAGAMVWLDIADPQADDIALLQRELGVHALAVEDLHQRNQRPKVDTYPAQHVIVTYEARPASGEVRPASGEVRPSGGEARLNLGEIHLIASARSLVSVHWGPSPALDDVRQRLQQRVGAIGQTVGAVLYAVLDTVVDGYFPLLDRLGDRIDDLEDDIVSGDQARDTLREVLAIKRELLELRRVLAPQRDVASHLLRRDVELLDDEAAPYYQDLFDHLVRVLDTLDLYRDLVASALDANLSVKSNTLNTVMKRLTAFTVVLMLPTLIASIYGMNFTALPGVQSPVAFWTSIVVMVLLAVVAAAYFKARDWF